jgi:hypothetical protein
MEHEIIFANNLVPVADERLIHLPHVRERPLAVFNNVPMAYVRISSEPNPIIPAELYNTFFSLHMLLIITNL